MSVRVQQLRQGIEGTSDRIAQQGIDQVAAQGEFIEAQSALAQATSEFAQASLVNQTGHGIAAKIIGLAKTVVQGYLGVA